MTKKAKTWTKPALTRLGRIADVAGVNSVGNDPGQCGGKNGAITCS